MLQSSKNLAYSSNRSGNRSSNRAVNYTVKEANDSTVRTGRDGESSALCRRAQTLPGLLPTTHILVRHQQVLVQRNSALFSCFWCNQRSREPRGGQPPLRFLQAFLGVPPVPYSLPHRANLSGCSRETFYCNYQTDAQAELQEFRSYVGKVVCRQFVSFSRGTAFNC
jgi:hypothetical protein